VLFARVGREAVREELVDRDALVLFGGAGLVGEGDEAREAGAWGVRGEKVGGRVYGQYV
jgi:hypothetical protein